MNATEASGAQKSLHENQVLRQADLEAQQRKENREVERQLEDELHRGNREVENSVEQQKKLVCKNPHFKYFFYQNPSTHLAITRVLYYRLQTHKMQSLIGKFYYMERT